MFMCSEELIVCWVLGDLRSKPYIIGVTKWVLLFKYNMACSLLTDLLRKAKALKFTNKVNKVSDLKPYYLCCLLGRQHAALSEQTLMLLGGELFQIRKQAVQQLRLGDNDASLQMRLRLTKEQQVAEHKWRSRLLQILELGRATGGLKSCVNHFKLFRFTKCLSRERLRMLVASFTALSRCI